MTFTLDPNLFRSDAIDPETAAFNLRLEQQLADLPATHEVPVTVTRQARDEGKGIFPSAGPADGSYWQQLPTRFGGRSVRISPAPAAPRALYLHIHGGGWSLGRPEHYDIVNQHLAAKCDVTVISVSYRLAPEHSWPACRQDCLNVAMWLAECGGDLFGTNKIIMGGESAGAHLAAVTALALRDGEVFMPRALVLNYGCFDLQLTPSMARWGARKLILSTPTVEWFVNNLDPEGQARSTPALSPLSSDLSGLPPALFQIGTCDPLMDDTLMMAARWAGAGLDADMAVYPGGVHAFDMFDLAISHQFRIRQIAYINDQIAAE